MFRNSVRNPQASAVGRFNGCPNPACEGGTESLRVKVDGRCSGGYFGWVRCTLCGVSGPTMRSEQDAINIWNKMTSGMTKNVTADLATTMRLLLDDCGGDCTIWKGEDDCKPDGPCNRRKAITLLGECIDQMIPNIGMSEAKKLDSEARARLSQDVKYDYKSIEYVNGGTTK